VETFSSLIQYVIAAGGMPGKLIVTGYGGTRLALLCLQPEQQNSMVVMEIETKQ
jgi:hypothetical protein